MCSSSFPLQLDSEIRSGKQNEHMAELQRIALAAVVIRICSKFEGFLAAALLEDVVMRKTPGRRNLSHSELHWAMSVKSHMIMKGRRGMFPFESA